jgi:hypothetical protein
MYCYYQKTVLIPEWQVGDIIAQRTERQGTSPFDFLSIQLPQFSLPVLREIRVSSHVNYDLRTDFITEYARASVRPINQFQTDIARQIPPRIGTDIGTPSLQIDAGTVGRPSSYHIPDTTHTSTGLITQIVESLI